MTREQIDILTSRMRDRFDEMNTENDQSPAGKLINKTINDCRLKRKDRIECMFILIDTLATRLNETEEQPKTCLDPSERGKLRHLETGGFYTANFTPGTPCTCKMDCPEACTGKCGCEACNEAFGDYLSEREE